MLFASGAMMKDVQMQLGHARITITMDIYTHVTKESEENISNLLANYLNSEAKSVAQVEKEETNSEVQFGNQEPELELQFET